MTFEERQLPGNFYKGLQNSLRGLSLFCLILFVFSSYVLPAVVTDAVTFDTLSIVLMVFMAVFGLVAIGMAVNSIVIRKKISRAIADGTAVEVVAPAYRAGPMRKGQGWTVGPISVIAAKETDAMFVEGMPARVLCVPSMKAALSINNVGLRHGARITCPPNLDSMAVPVGMPTLPSIQPTGDQYPPSSASIVQQPAPSENADDLPPPPPPPD